MCGESTLRVGRVICINRRELCALSFLKFSHFIWMPEILCGCAECVHPGCESDFESPGWGTTNCMHLTAKTTDPIVAPPELWRKSSLWISVCLLDVLENF